MSKEEERLKESPLKKFQEAEEKIFKDSLEIKEEINNCLIE